MKGLKCIKKNPERPLDKGKSLSKKIDPFRKNLERIYFS